MECTAREDLGVQWLKIKGRIDGLSSGELRRLINDLVNRGHRIFVVELGDVNYISSAGLRVFLEAQKQLRNVEGEIFLFGLAGTGMKTFEMSGFLPLFKSMSSRIEVEAALKPADTHLEVESREVMGISFRHIKRDGLPADLKIIGSQERLRSSTYTEADVITLPANEIPYGFGLAALGDAYDEYMNLFGEALVLNRNLFFYPCAKNPVADFMLCTQSSSNPDYRFLNGIGFSGPFHHILSFESDGDPVEVPRLVQALLEFAKGNIVGVVLLAESKGFWGMNIRKSPIIGNKPGNGMDIFDRTNFREWMNFPVEPGELNNIVACAGIAVRDRNAARVEFTGFLPEGSCFHMHGAVFPNAPLSKEAAQFEKELNRIVSELEVSKVQHVLGQSKFGSGMAGLIELRD
ncbi:MAG: anti-sigma factor antagonist [Desulfobacteraceae bacterium]|nr:MAG: anti-sigma factor antagonist [Desulfobacteraceae bacterium]